MTMVPLWYIKNNENFFSKFFTCFEIIDSILFFNFVCFMADFKIIVFAFDDMLVVCCPILSRG